MRDIDRSQLILHNIQVVQINPLETTDFNNKSIQSFSYDPHIIISNGETFLQDLFEDMFLQYYMHSDMFSMFLALQYCVSRCGRLSNISSRGSRNGKS